MFASFQSKQLNNFYCRIKAEPVLVVKDILVYELVDSQFPNSIIDTVRGQPVAEYRHVALDSAGNGFVFDLQNKKIAFSVGPSEYIKD
ncbi:hypothetical protein [Rheinheimera sp. 1928-s]|uniref:hypothetical protein n=1 Tax=Rheinheimera sp. 1928-s TaxID=3033803 RepID=UPI002615D9CA|nr:hypothetical protein [Rheinheimera sp. 1928-s]MDF3124736.1 hypothetical protein [Rheinheimera sp. 1928-s]